MIFTQNNISKKYIKSKYFRGKKSLELQGETEILSVLHRQCGRNKGCKKFNLGNNVYLLGVFPVVMYECESWTVKKAEHWKIDAFVGEDSWESLGLQREPTSPS